MMRTKMISALAACALALAACGGGGGGGAAATGAANPASVKLPSKLTLVQPKNNANAVKMLSGVSAAYRAVSSGAMRAFVAPANSDYATDPTSHWTMVEGQDALATVNEVLCILDQANPNGVLARTGNQAATYVAKVNMSRCQQNQGNQGGGQQGAQGSKSKSVQYANMTVSVTPGSAAAPMSVKFWLHLPKDPMMPGEQRVHGTVVATKGASQSNPFGEWIMNWDFEMTDPMTGKWFAGRSSGAAASGAIKAQVTASGSPELLYYEGEFGWNQAAVIRFAPGQKTNGTALVKQTYNPALDPTNTGGANNGVQVFGDYGIAFDANYVLTQNNQTNTSTCRSRTQFTDSVMQYGLYHAAAGQWKGKAVSKGQRVNLNVGFPFTVTRNQGGQNVQIDGWASNWGVFLMDGTPLQDLEKVQRVTNFATGATQQLTAYVSKGAMNRTTVKQVPISQLTGIDFDYWDSTAKTEYRARFNATTGHLEGVATITWGQTGPQETALNPAVDLTPGTNLSPLDIYLWPMGGFSASRYVLHLPANTAPTTLTTVNTTTYERVDVSDPALQGLGLTLWCWNSCPVGGSPGTLHPVMVNGTWMGYAYTAQVVGHHLQLIDNATNQPVTGSQQNPVYLSQLTTSSTAPWAQGVAPATTQYDFQSDGQSWSQTVAFVDANGQAVTFDKPIAFSYTHSQLNDRNNSATYANQTFNLVFDGYNLMGFPFKLNQNGWFESAVSLKDGVTLTDAAGNAFVVKALDVMQTPNTTPNGCTGLGAPTGLTLPTSALPQAVNFAWAAKPAVTKGPRVIDGVVQY